MKNILRNFMVALRSYTLSSVLNVLGLALALFTATVISIQAYYEYSFDSATPNAERIYRVTYPQTDQLPLPLLDLVVGASQHIEAYAINDMWSDLELYVSGDGDNFIKHGIQSVSPALLQKMITPQIVEGAYSSLDGSKVVAISRKTAELIYGKSRNVVGRSLTVRNDDSPVEYSVGVVYEDMATNSVFRNSIYRKMDDPHFNTGKWDNYCACLYVMLDNPASADVVRGELSKIKFDRRDADSSNFATITPIEELYFSDMSLVNVPRGNQMTTNVMILVAILILIVSAINFINFSFAIAPRRVKSVTIHRIFGSSVAAIRASIVGETMIFAAIAYILSLAALQLLEPLVGELVSTPTTMVGNGGILALVFGVALVIGAVAGLSSAYYLSKQSKKAVAHRSGGWLRGLLLGFQYVVSSALVVVALVMNSQIDYLKNRDLGFDKDNILLFEISPQAAATSVAPIEEALRAIQQITDVAFSADKFGAQDIVGGLGRQFKNEQLTFQLSSVSHNFPQFMGIEIKDGRPFSPTDLVDRSGSPYRLIFNSTAAKRHNINPSDTIQDEGTVIVGVMDDFNYNSLKYEVTPFAFMCFVRGREWMPQGWVYCKYSGDAAVAIEAIRRAMLPLDEGTLPTIEELSAVADTRYVKDNNQTMIISFFSLLSILISLSGVVSLVLIEIKSRAAEIALRKIHGAELSDILTLVNRKFFITSLISSLIAMPVAYYFVRWWLDGFAFRVELAWWYFTLGAVIVVVITTLLVSLCCYRVARANALKTLKSTK